MHLKVISVGKVKDKHLATKIAEFEKRLRHYGKFEALEIKDSSREKESERLMEIIEREKGYIFVLSEEGNMFTSREFAAKLEAIHQKIILVIGGPFGMEESVKQKADCLMSLSPMTFTHEMAHMFLVEQLFRASSIVSGGAYHND